MKRLFYFLFLLFPLLTFTGCEDITTQDTSKITYYVTFEMKGSEVMLLPVNTPYVEPGVTALENGKDVTSSMKTTGTVNSSKLGLYPIEYSAVNTDGFPSSVTRTVIVYNPAITTDISGDYTVAPGTYRKNSSGVVTNYSGYPVELIKVAPGIFHVSDYFGGYYDKRAGYGANYAMTGYCSLNPDNTISLLSSFVKGWGDSLDFLKNAKFDTATNNVYWEAGYGGSLTFYVTLKK